MAMIKKNHIPASSLLETLAAMVIIIVSFSAGFGIFEQVLYANRTELRVVAKAEALRLIHSYQTDLNPTIETQSNNLIIQESWSNYETGTLKHEIVIHDKQGKQVYKIQKIVSDDSQ